ncbi:hypothetical protein MGYG_08971 [Nannizzia gypsea CBS 118893]|uniref:Altered inheritance of mitochondria protein 9, mitochondrial n=1 Tax=Arthroderma gypseum (strain ATCC MYA-4604 / CBS 118893) TaxID=535722 RepID=E4UR84_ARTGP|nr:hypothetical protein MGYG_08971 [Nannizzia gypsea CBS 118893]EFQ99359.1 hypothetical protein MGYG_08971 [Nannizzia gypsea CBS 118893]
MNRPVLQIFRLARAHFKLYSTEGNGSLTNESPLLTAKSVHNKELSEYVRGRFIFDENEQMIKRRLGFDMHALTSAAANSVGATRCINIQRCPDGLYNKAFILSMDNGKEVIAKLPNLNAGIPYYTTASEVASMDFAREVLQTPVPQVYAWNASAEVEINPVGAEYIIMEKVSRVPLSQIWWNLQLKQKLKFFPKLHGGSVTKYRKAICDREMMAVKALTRVPKQLAMLYGPKPLYKPSAEKKLKALQYYSQIQQLLTPNDPSLTTGHLWHNDLHDENIFVDPDSLEIQGIIDWQSSHIAPLTDHCMDPSFLEYEGPDIGGDLEKPELPAEIKSLNGEEKEAAVAQYLDKVIITGWRRLTNSGAPGFPLKFTEAEVSFIEADVERAEFGVRTMKMIEQRLSNLWPEKGVVEHENYEETKEALRQIKGEIIEEFKTYPGWDSEVFESLWPFDH